MPGGGGKLLRPRLSTHRPRAPGQFGVTYGVFPPPSIRPAPTLLTTAPIPLANDSRHDIGDTAFGAGPTLGTAGREGGHFVLLPDMMPLNATRRQ